MFHHKLIIIIKINRINSINHLNQCLIMFLKGLIMLLRDLKIGYNKIDFKDHALFKVKDKIILIHKFIDPKGREHGGEQLSSPLAPSEDEDLLLDLPLTGGDVSIISPHMVVSELIPSYLLLTLIISISAFFKRFEFCCFLFFFSVDCFGLESGFGKVDLDDFDDFE